MAGMAVGLVEAWLASAGQRLTLCQLGNKPDDAERRVQPLIPHRNEHGTSSHLCNRAVAAQRARRACGYHAEASVLAVKVHLQQVGQLARHICVGKAPAVGPGIACAARRAS